MHLKLILPFIFLTSSHLVTAAKNPKRGLAFAATNSPLDIINANQSASVVSWQYNWNSFPPVYLATSNIPFVPMQWGSASIDSFQGAVDSQGSKVILTFNEPDYVNEANVDPKTAAQLWMQYIQPLKAQGVRLGGPAVTASSTGAPWLQAFFSACTNCTIDFLPLHWYGEGSAGFYDYLWSVHQQYPQYPIWVTEFADTSSNVTDVLDFMNSTLTYLDNLAWVERYSWFGFFRPQPNVNYNMLDNDGGLNALGQLYTGAQTIHTSVITSAPSSVYMTLSGSDIPGQAPASTWAPLAGSSIPAVRSPIFAAFAAMIALFLGSLITFL